MAIGKRQPNRKTATRPSPAAAQKTLNTTPVYVVLVLLFVIYLAVQGLPSVAIVIGAAIFFTIIILLAIEIRNGIKEEGFSRNAIEVVGAIAAVLILWYGLRFLLNTPYPLDVVPSCSMLPVLNRGDMILLQGVNHDNINAPVVNVSQSAWSAEFSNLNYSSLQCVAYNTTPYGVRVSQIIKPGYSIGLLQSTGSGQQIIQPSSQTGLIKYWCGAVNVEAQNGSMIQEAYTKSVSIANTTVSWNKNNSVVVYQTVPQDQFYKYGDTYIVHRVYAMVDVNGTYYSLTKGDNNPGLDIQYFNVPPNLTYVQGKVIGSIPFVGYLKLILSNNFIEPAGCNTTVQN